MNTHDVDEGPRRARCLDELTAVLEAMVTPEGVTAGLAFEPRASDVVVSSFAKCGTTWLQQIVHALRSEGDLDFDDISRVVPWIETSFDLSLDLDDEQVGHPRAFKSHLGWEAVPKGARYIVSLRDPRDAALSMYRFLEGWMFEPGSIDVEEFVRSIFLETRRYYTHLESWWRRRDETDVLLLAYEHMKEDLDATVAKVSIFIGTGDDPGLLALAREQASLESMSANRSKYDDLLMRERGEAVAELPAGGESSKVAAGRVGQHRHAFSPELTAEFDEVWADTLGVDLGLPDYRSVLTQLVTE